MKVHGSLARAGKVRSQTPKVAKQVEGQVKGKVGRAKKRFLYNKRYQSLKTDTKRTKPNSQVAQAESKKFKETQKERITISKDAKLVETAQKK